MTPRVLTPYTGTPVHTHTAQARTMKELTLSVEQSKPWCHLGNTASTLSAHNTGHLHLQTETESGDEDVQGANGTKDKIWAMLYVLTRSMRTGLLLPK